MQTKLYGIYIKSHCAAPDFEAEVEAVSKIDALAKFRQMPQLADFSINDLLNLMEEVR